MSDFQIITEFTNGSYSATTTNGDSTEVSGIAMVAGTIGTATQVLMQYLAAKDLSEERLIEGLNALNAKLEALKNESA
jgi:hypothetical protein